MKIRWAERCNGSLHSTVDLQTQDQWLWRGCQGWETSWPDPIPVWAQQYFQPLFSILFYFLIWKFSGNSHFHASQRAFNLDRFCFWQLWKPYFPVLEIPCNKSLIISLCLSGTGWTEPGFLVCSMFLTCKVNHSYRGFTWATRALEYLILNVYSGKWRKLLSWNSTLQTLIIIINRTNFFRNLNISSSL